MDGVPGFTQVSCDCPIWYELKPQCPIAPGSSFTYRFTVDDQFGTYWYVASSTRLTTGGILIIATLWLMES